MLTADSFFAVTLFSCLAIGLGFVIAVGLLVFAGVIIGWVLPHRLGGPNRPREAPDSGSRRSD